MNVRERWKEQAETAGGHWKNSALLTKDREKIQTSERDREEEDGQNVTRGKERKSVNNRKWLLFVVTVPTTVRAGKEKESDPYRVSVVLQTWQLGW